MGASRNTHKGPMDKPKGDRIEGGRWGRGGQWQETETTTIK